MFVLRDGTNPPKFHEDLISESNIQVTSSAISSALLSLQAVGEH